MTRERWKQLMGDCVAGAGLQRLTLEEMESKWHFCDEWDGLLVGPEMEEFEFCSCYRDKIGIEPPEARTKYRSTENSRSEPPEAFPTSLTWE